ncbi:G patch domain-containing protein 4 [Takifugu flavidus]|uniref:G patch domain-containing protein 4 n=1 Tax=Takifugu flavidus TaxID=433684 RepID=UPI0025446F7B|nr:G patch domain-containing protein 4 [Takifugu flavidus]
MAEGKNRGLTFAEKQLLCHGWKHGKGLGRAENGISEAIKVKVKSDKAGVGHNEGDKFTFHWWDHVFNKASSSLQVETDQNGVQLKKNLDSDEEGGMVSNKKPLKASFTKDKLYGCFVKSATLLSGQEHPEPKSPPDGSSSSEEEQEHKLDLSTTTNLSDADLISACGGRTAHKGARYGLTMSAKLARLEQQEAEFMAKYGKKKESPSPSCATPDLQSAVREEETDEDSMSKVVKEKGVCEKSEVTRSTDADISSKKKKRKREDKMRVSAEEGEACVETTKKRKKKNADAEQFEGEKPLAPERKTKKKKSSKEPKILKLSGD